MQNKKQNNWASSILKTVAKKEKESEFVIKKVAVSTDGRIFGLVSGKWVRL